MRTRVLVGAVALASLLSAARMGIPAGDAATPSRPRLLSIRYGQFQPRGAPQKYLALQLRTRMKHGQVVSLQVERVDPPPAQVMMADGACGTAAKRDGAVGVWTLPARLAPGDYRFRVTMEGKRCRGGGRTRTSQRTVALHVPG